MRIIFVSVLLFAGFLSSTAQTFSYELSVRKVAFNDDSTRFDTPIKFNGTAKKQSELHKLWSYDGGTTYIATKVEVLKEGKGKNAGHTARMKYYLVNGEGISLLSVTPRHHYIGKYFNESIYEYIDKTNGDRLEVDFTLDIKQE